MPESTYPCGRLLHAKNRSGSDWPRCDSHRQVLHIAAQHSENFALPASDTRFSVPGSSSGMGFEVAKCLSQENATVIIAARNKQKCEK